jgi:hypothetical protein
MTTTPARFETVTVPAEPILPSIAEHFVAQPPEIPSKTRVRNRACG